MELHVFRFPNISINKIRITPRLKKQYPFIFVTTVAILPALGATSAAIWEAQAEINTKVLIHRDVLQKEPGRWENMKAFPTQLIFSWILSFGVLGSITLCFPVSSLWFASDALKQKTITRDGFHSNYNHLNIHGTAFPLFPFFQGFLFTRWMVQGNFIRELQGGFVECFWERDQLS